MTWPEAIGNIGVVLSVAIILGSLTNNIHIGKR